MTFARLSILLSLSAAFLGSAATESSDSRDNTPRLRSTTGFPNLEATFRQTILEADEGADGEDENAFDEMMDAFDVDEFMSMTIEPTLITTDMPSDMPSDVPSDQPSMSPSLFPTTEPSIEPSLAPTTFTPAPTESMMPSTSPSVSQAPSPSEPVPSSAPSTAPSPSPTTAPSLNPTFPPSISPSSPPSGGVKGITTVPPTFEPTANPTALPTGSPTEAPTKFPTESPTFSPTVAPTVEGCPGVTAEARIEAILTILRDASDLDKVDLIQDISTPQGQATDWLLERDFRKLCPDDPKILQRWALAVMYFSTGGDQWFQCSNSLAADDDCGFELPPNFLEKQRFLSAFNECEWAGIVCNDLGCVTEVEFELNNLRGTIPTEMAHLTDLEVWGMERGGLTGTIPTEIERLSNLIFLDLDFNMLTGSLTTQLLSLTALEQLDLNDNLFTGSINGIGVFQNMVFLQLHDNEFTGTVPEAVGGFQRLAAFTLHETDISGVMPSSICGMMNSNGGPLRSLIANCRGGNPDIECSCCTDCRG